jgi:hypothetical protein
LSSQLSSGVVTLISAISEKDKTITSHACLTIKTTARGRALQNKTNALPWHPEKIFHENVKQLSLISSVLIHSHLDSFTSAYFT